jgi:hypothetical protein
VTSAERFAALAAEENEREEATREGIGTYAEKRLHRILKRFVSAEHSDFEVPVGRFVADVVSGKEILEIQTGSFRPLLPKLRYYLEMTDCSISVIHPVFATKNVIRMERETGEVLRRRKTHVGGRTIDGISELYSIMDVLGDPRLRIRILRLEVDEYRYSERIRYRKEGAYDSELFPRELLEEVVLRSPEDYRCFLPEERSFTASEYGARMKLKGRALYSVLNVLCAVGLLERTTEGRKYRYTVI